MNCKIAKRAQETYTTMRTPSRGTGTSRSLLKGSETKTTARQLVGEEGWGEQKVTPSSLGGGKEIRLHKKKSNRGKLGFQTSKMWAGKAKTYRFFPIGHLRTKGFSLKKIPCFRELPGGRLR